MVYSIIFIVLAAICCACMDTLQHHYYNSVFNKLNDKFWNPAISWGYAKTIPFTKYKVDAWHLFKSAMICLLIGAVVMAWQSGEALFNVWWFYLIAFIYIGIMWNLTFNFFYNIILIRK